MGRAIFASIIATAVISALLYVNVRMALLPSFDLLVDIAAFNRRIGLPSTTQAVWVSHAIIGVFIYGVLFAVLKPILPGHGGTAGMWFGFIAWLTMMVSFMPLSGHLIFGQDLGLSFAAITLVMHLLYGAVLGISYSALSENED